MKKRQDEGHVLPLSPAHERPIGHVLRPSPLPEGAPEIDRVGWPEAHEQLAARRLPSPTPALEVAIEEVGQRQPPPVLEPRLVDQRKRGRIEAVPRGLGAERVSPGRHRRSRHRPPRRLGDLSLPPREKTLRLAPAPELEQGGRAQDQPRFALRGEREEAVGRLERRDRAPHPSFQEEIGELQAERALLADHHMAGMDGRRTRRPHEHLGDVVGVPVAENLLAQQADRGQVRLRLLRPEAGGAVEGVPRVRPAACLEVGARQLYVIAGVVVVPPPDPLEQIQGTLPPLHPARLPPGHGEEKADGVAVLRGLQLALERRDVEGRRKWRRREGVRGRAEGAWGVAAARRRKRQDQ